MGASGNLLLEYRILVLTYIVCVAIAAVLWGALAQDECDEDDPPETMYN